MYKFSQLVSSQSQTFNLKLILQKLQKSHISGHSKKFITLLSNKKAGNNITNKIKSNRNLSSINKNKKSNERFKIASNKQAAEIDVDVASSEAVAANSECADQLNINEFPVPSDESANGKDLECVVPIEVPQSVATRENNDTTPVSNNMLSSPVYSQFREWNNTALGSAIMASPNSWNGHGVPFTLVSYNILAQELLEKYKYIYKNHSQIFLPWNHRLHNLKNELLTLRPQILCLQEVQENHLYEILSNVKELNLSFIFKMNTGVRNDGCAILYDKNMFELIEQHDVEFYQPQTNHLDRHNVGIIAKFCLKSSSASCILVATAHLLYNPNRQDVRLAQIQLLLAELDRYSIVRNQFTAHMHPKRIPILLTGDFNLEPYSAPYRLVTEGHLFYENLSRNLLELGDHSSALTGRVFLPSKLGITDNCQHIDMITNCYQGSTRLQNTYQNVTTTKDNDPLLKKYAGLFSTGKLSHGLNFSSAYRHRSEDNFQECSTFQDRWITVDYIFYSKYFSPKINSICEGYLNLLSRYSLPSIKKCQQMGLVPNANLGSDHLALAAKFFLKFPYVAS